MAEIPVPTYSISVRLQRTTTEFAFVSIPATADLIAEQPDGTGRLDAARMIERGVEMGKQPGVAWQHESQEVQPHPLQVPPPWAEGTSTDG